MADSRRPNVLLIIMDDLAWGDLACHGNPYVRTPNLDRLHAQSTRLTRYRSAPVCTPARARLMTGRYPYRTRAIDTYCGRSMMEPDEVTLPEVLRDAGYRTGISGKWHLGDCHPMRAIDQGFEHALVHNGGGLAQPGNWGRDDYFDPDLMHDGRIERHEGYCTDIFADDAMRFIEQHREEPWFCYLATNAPHTPLWIADEWAQRYRDMGVCETHARLYGMVENIDYNVGRVLDRLDALNLSDDTIVIYTSDHGPCGGAHDATHGDRWNGGLRGRKATPYEGGLRVPFFIRWPGRFEAGRDLDRIANPMDVMPTLATLCGAQMPTDRAIDGCDLSPLLLNERAVEDWPDRTIFYQWHRGDVPQRYRNFAATDQRWKLLCSALGPRRDPQDVVLEDFSHDHLELYDLEADPHEQHDLSADQPDVLQRLREAYDRWFDDVCATRGDATFDPPRIHVGSAHENPTVLTRQDWRMYGETDSFKNGPPGWWAVEVCQGGAHAIRVRLCDEHPAGTVTVRCGDVQHSATIEANAVYCTFEDVALEAGPASVEAWLTPSDAGEAVAPWFVFMRAGAVAHTGTTNEL